MHGEGQRSEPELSVIIPILDERDSLEQLHAEVVAACESTDRPFEIVFVDDGSTDGSAELLDRLADEDARLTVVHFRRNFGKSPALAAAFQVARGQTVITMDGDLQDDPRLIPDFVTRIDEGADLVSGFKKERKDPIGKRIPSKIFNRVVRLVSGVPLRDFNCGFKAYRRACIEELDVYGGLHRFLPVMAGERGFRIEELVVTHHPRKHGRSKFGARRFAEGFLDLLTVLLLTRYRLRPLHFFGIPGAIAGLAGFSILIYLTILWFRGHGIGTRPLLTLGVLLVITAAQFLAVGLLGELLVRTTVQQREIYSIRSIRRAGEEKKAPHFDRHDPTPRG